MDFRTVKVSIEKTSGTLRNTFYYMARATSGGTTQYDWSIGQFIVLAGKCLLIKSKNRRYLH